ncbi:hypothetical protein [Streptomyces sp. NPDC094149]|uniref:hypothetical protein n=1 Tax=Streptomyces sp. NPDC094149 TaxID=3155079 RepID=UPI003330ED3B
MTRWLRDAGATGLLVAVGVLGPLNAGGVSYAGVPTAGAGGGFGVPGPYATTAPRWGDGSSTPWARETARAHGSASARPGAPAHRDGPHEAVRVPVPVPSWDARAAEPSRAGSVAGEGRQRPGRPEEKTPTADPTDQEQEQQQQDEANTADPQENADDTGAAESPEAVGSAPAVPATPEASSGRDRQAVTRAVAPAEPVLRILPLGSGLVLIGLGLGLAFVGLRLRRA